MLLDAAWKIRNLRQNLLWDSEDYGWDSDTEPEATAHFLTALALLQQAEQALNLAHLKAPKP